MSASRPAKVPLTISLPLVALGLVLVLVIVLVYQRSIALVSEQAQRALLAEARLRASQLESHTRSMPVGWLEEKKGPVIALYHLTSAGKPDLRFHHRSELPPEAFSEDSLLEKLSATPSGQVVRGLKLGKESMLAVVQVVGDDHRLLLALPRRVALGAAHSYGGFALMCTLFVVSALYITHQGIQRRFARPVELLTEGARQLKQASGPIKAVPSDHEFRPLQDAINDLSEPGKQERDP